MPKRKSKKIKAHSSGKLRIGDSWNAITIIALSQANPLKAVAEFVENSIDAGARHITVTRGKERGRLFLRITDDGAGIPLDEQGIPNFKYVATHICDSIKRQLKMQGVAGIQGEYGIGLLSFWTVGETLTLTSPSADGRAYEMVMAKGDPGYTVRKRRLLFPQRGTELQVQPLLPGIKQLSGEKMQWYLASELRDRLRNSGVKVTIIDRQARRKFQVEPRRFSGRLLHELPAPGTDLGELYIELYLDTHNPQNRVGLYRSGTRVLADLADLQPFQGEPWNSGYLQGIVDAPFLTLTPGTRSGIVQDDRFVIFCEALQPLEKELDRIIDAQKRAEEERASRKILQSVQKAIKEALLALPADEYDWFEIRVGERKRPGQREEHTHSSHQALIADSRDTALDATEAKQKAFFEIAGPLYSVRILPAASTIPVGGSKSFRAVPRDRQRRLVERDVHFTWEIVEGDGLLAAENSEIATFTAPAEPGLTTLRVQVEQDDIRCSALSLVTVTASLLKEPRKSPEGRRGLPGYTFHKASGELWRSRYDAARNLIIINNGHRDFVYASLSRARKIRYICKLFAKELVSLNFPGLPPDELLERMVELSLYTEEHLK